MSKVQEVKLKLATCQPVDYKESAIIKALSEQEQLIVEPKHDGVQLNLVVDEKGDVTFLSRAGKEFDALNGHTTQAFMQVMKSYALSGYNPHHNGYVIQGELMALSHSDNTPLSAAVTAGHLRRKDSNHNQRYVYVIFAVLPLDEIKESTTKPINIPRHMQNVNAKTLIWGFEQMAAVSGLTSPMNIIMEAVQQTVVYCVEDTNVEADGIAIPSLMGAYRSARKRGLEGVVVWKIDQPWHRGKKTGGWKIKPNETYDGRVVGYFYGGAAMTRSLVVGFEVELEDSGHVVNVDGFTNTLSIEVTADPESYIGSIVEVSCMEKLPSGSLRHPKFKSFRGITSPEVKE